MAEEPKFYDCEETGSSSSLQHHIQRSGSNDGNLIPSQMMSGGGGGLPPRGGSQSQGGRGASPSKIISQVPPNSSNNSISRGSTRGGNNSRQSSNGLSGGRTFSPSPGGLSGGSLVNSQYAYSTSPRRGTGDGLNTSAASSHSASSRAVHEIARGGVESPILGERADALQHQYKMEKAHRQYVEIELQQKTLDVDVVIEHHMDKVKGHYEERIRQLESAIGQKQREVSQEQQLNQQQREGYHQSQQDQLNKAATHRQNAAASRGGSVHSMQGTTVIYGGDRSSGGGGDLFNTTPNNRSNNFNSQGGNQTVMSSSPPSLRHNRGSVGFQQSSSPHRGGDGSFQSAHQTGRRLSPQGRARESYDMQRTSPMRNPYGGTDVHSFSDSIGSPTHWDGASGNYYDSVLQRVKQGRNHQGVGVGMPQQPYSQSRSPAGNSSPNRTMGGNTSPVRFRQQ